MDQEHNLAWEELGRKPGPDLKLFRARFDRVRNPRNGLEMEAIVLETPDWVNVLALTPAGKLVVVRQYRFGTASVTTEFPAGTVEPGESTREAAIRELKEETGYTSDAWESLGYVEPNPAFLDNRCHHWLARDAVRTAPARQDDGENLEVLEMDFDGIRREIEAGRMRHALAVTALYFGASALHWRVPHPGE